MDELLKHLIQAHQKQFLYELFGIKATTWRKHKEWEKTNGTRGQRLSPMYYNMVQDKYYKYLQQQKTGVESLPKTDNENGGGVWVSVEELESLASLPILDCYKTAKK